MKLLSTHVFMKTGDEVLRKMEKKYEELKKELATGEKRLLDWYEAHQFKSNKPNSHERREECRKLFLDSGLGSVDGARLLALWAGFEKPVIELERQLGELIVLMRNLGEKDLVSLTFDDLVYLGF